MKPPQSTPTARTFALPAASASYGESPMATALSPSIDSFFRTASNMSGSGFVARHRRMRFSRLPISRSSDIQIFFELALLRRGRDGDPEARVASPLKQVWHRRERPDQWQILGFEMFAPPGVELLPVVPLGLLGRKTGMSLSPPLPI